MNNRISISYALHMLLTQPGARARSQTQPGTAAKDGAIMKQQLKRTQSGVQQPKRTQSRSNFVFRGGNNTKE